MSDRAGDIRRSYGRNVSFSEIVPHRKELCTIPEYPEDDVVEGRGMWTEVLHSLLTTLRYLAPATLLAIFWGHNSFLFKVLRQLEAALRSIIYSSDKQSALVLQWVSESSPVQVSCLEHVWRHGWLLCGVLERALPGACGGHPHAPLSIEHAQTLAEQYLGVQPVFSRQEFESTEVLTKRQEWKLAHYLDRMRQALNRLSPPVSKPNTPRIAHDTQAYTLDYVARGVGLCAAQTNRKMCFKIYPTAQQCLEPGEINVLIRGPVDSFGTASVPPIYGRAQLLRQAFLGLDVKSQYTQGSLPLTQGTAYLRSYGKNDMNKTFHIPRVKQDIEIEISVRRDHTRVTYSAGLDGIYEISLTSRGYNLIGSPFRVCASDDNMECNTSTDLDDDEECGIVDVKNDRRVVFRIVDFVTEKMLLNDNGSLEKITDEEANELMSNAKPDRISEIDVELHESLKQFDLIENDTRTNELTCKRFKSATTKIITMINVCDSFKATLKNKNKVESELEGNITSHMDIPDIVHSMIFDKKGSTDAKILEQSTLETDTIYIVENSSTTDAISPRQNELDDICSYGDSNEIIITNFDRNSVRYGKSVNNDVITAHQSESDHKLYCETPIEMIITNVKNNDFRCDNLVESEILSPSQSNFDEKCYNDDPSETIITNIYDNSVRYEKPVLISQNCIELDSPQNVHVSSISDNTSDTYYSFAEDEDSESKLFSKNPFLCQIPDNYEGILETENMKSVGNSITCDPFNDEIIDEDTNILSTADHNLIQILVEIDEEEMQVPTNPFIDVEVLERPKTPILKIITGEIKDRKDSIYVDPKFKLPDVDVTSYDELRKSNEFLNPFFYHNSVGATALMPPPTADFIIGAPVSLPPFLKAPSPEPDMDSIILAANLEEALHKYDKRVQNMVQSDSSDRCESLFSTPVPMTPTNKFITEETGGDTESTFHSTEYYSNESVECTSQAIKIPKDLWDSAYVSIDDSNSSPDSNNNSEITNKIKVLDSDFFNMGPAEREIWQKCADIKTDPVDLHEQDIYQLPELKRSTITTILEENEKSITTTQSYLVDKELVCTTKEPEDNKQDSITAALTELNDIYKEYFISSENSSLAVVPEKEKFQSVEVNFAISENEYDVNSASETKSDVKRHSEYEDVAAISEVQSYATESFSASRALEDSLNNANKDAPVRHDLTMFGDKPSGKLVNERKKYWDEKIKAIEEIKAQQQRKRKITSKHLKLNDSLSKRKGKHIAKNLAYLAESEPFDKKQLNGKEHVEPMNEPQTEIKLVDKWKRYWDERLITAEETTSSCVPENKVNNTKPSTSPVRIPVPPTKHLTSPVRMPVPPSKHPTSPVRILVPPTKYLPSTHLTPLPLASENNKILRQNDSGESTPEDTLPRPEINSPIKHDITDEQVFKAFETSPKRFFGNSRKNILEKIDAFSGKPNADDNPETISLPGVRCNLGIVSSRISMFNIDRKNEDNVHKHKDILPGTNMQKRASVSKTYLNKITIIDNIEDVEISDDNCVTDKREPISEETAKLKNIKEKVRKLSTSKSEMDIFNKTQYKSDDLDNHKSCEDLYRVSVRNFISLFENVTKTDVTVKNNNNEDNNLRSTADTITPLKDVSFQSRNTDECTVLPEQPHFNPILEKTGSLSVSNDKAEVVNQHLPTKTPTIDDVEVNYDKDKTNVEFQPPDEEPKTVTIEYKQRFKMAKKFFQSLEELKYDDADKPQKLNECEMILYRQLSLNSQSTESLPQTPKLKKKKTVRAHSAPTSDCEYDPSSVGEQWENYGTGAGGRRLIKISEKFQVDDLFKDVAGEGKLSRRGSFRGIPHKHAVLATFKSMENVTDSQMTSYEMSVSQLSDFAKENQIKNAQTYLTEYPYLPRTEPSKYRSRLDNKASGLISRKELLKHHMRPRRNSVPDALRLNERFTATM